MGLCHSGNSSGSSEARILMLGLDSAGKTTILYKMKLNETVTTIPTIGFNVESVKPMKGLTFTLWDVGGQDKIRPLWRHYYAGVDGLVYVVDSSDRERMSQAREELFRVLESDEMGGVPVLVLANKQDLSNAMTASNVVEELNLITLGARSWYVQSTCATTGDGIYEGMHQLAEFVKEYKKKK